MAGDGWHSSTKERQTCEEEAMAAALPNRTYHFGAFELDRSSGELRKRGVKIKLQVQPFQILILLLDHPGELVSREEIRRQLWPENTFVDFDNAISSAVWKVREALGDSSQTPRFIETVARRGYRFVAPVYTNDEAFSVLKVQSAPNFGAGTVQSAVKHLRIRVLSLPLSLWAILGSLCAILIAYIWFAGAKSHRAAEVSRHVTSHARDLTLSRDGKLVAYIAAVAGDMPHVWVRQTSGDKAIQSTNGPQPDMMPDLSPDGTQIAFVSARGEGGIYVVPSFGGEPKHIVAGAVAPRFSPDRKTILYLDGERHPFTIPAEGGRPTLIKLPKDVQVLTAPLWSASGKEIIFYGIRNLKSQELRDWWIAPLNGGEPTRGRLPGVERDHGLFPAVRDWYRSKDNRNWILYAVDAGDRWSLFRVETFASGQIARQSQQIATGEGQLGKNSRLSEDGKLAYNTIVLGGAIYEIPVDKRGERTGLTRRFSLSEELNCHSPSVSRDGRWMVYTTSMPAKPNRALLRDLQSGAEQLLDDRVSGADGGTNSISPDGSNIIVGHDCKEGRCAFLVRRAGAEPQRLCERCVARGFSSDVAVVLMEKDARPGEGWDRIIALDLATKTERGFLSDPNHPLYQAYFSWDDKWVVFKRELGGTSQIIVAPVRKTQAGKQESWIAVTDGRYIDDKPRFSADGSVYFLSSRDGHICLWKQKLDATTRHPVGPPVPYEHLHSQSFDFFRLGRTELNVSKRGVVIGIPEVISDLWIKQVD
jgi:Tol biopolymer transport system component/DNA-binding winged helix-turn-helix (wHTH) protein